MFAFFEQWLIPLQLSPALTTALAAACAVLTLLIGAKLFHAIIKNILNRTIHILLTFNARPWDQLFSQYRFFDRLAHIPTAIMLIVGLSGSLAAYPQIGAIGERLLWVYLYVSTLMSISALINVFSGYYNQKPSMAALPITSISQLLKLLLTMVVLILTVAEIIDQSPLFLLSGFGALTAVVLLAFRDSILGFIASLQVASNDMINKHDWIEMPQYGADGEVLEVGLNTVKVQNWDKTVTTIPTYALMSEAFKNWRHMYQAGGRRVKRAVFLDLNSISFATPDQLKQWQNIALLQPYLTTKEAQLAPRPDHNEDVTHPANRRRLTNIGTFRAYVEAYLRQHPQVNDNLTLLVRQLPVGAEGLPLECYFFIGDTRWAHYEGIQADIFDHLFATAAEFDLRLFQSPSGHDFQRLKS